MKIDIDSFVVFECIVTQGSFAKAADKLGRVQSNISYQVNKLEQQLGIELFDRSQYRAELTPAGRAILVECRRLLAQVSHISGLASSYQQGWESNLMIVIDGALPMAPVMQVLKKIAEQNIPTKIVLKVEYLGGVQKRFMQEEASLMLVKDYDALPSLIAQPLPPVINYLCVSGDHPLASIDKVSREQLLNEVELTVNDSADRDYANQSHQFGGDRVFYFSSFADKKQAVKMGLGYGWLPKFLIKNELTAQKLVKVDFIGGNEYQFTPKLVYCDERPLAKAGQLLQSLLVDAFQRFSY